MKATLAVLGLALFAVLAECKRAEEPAQNLLRKQILEKLAARGKLGEQNFGSEKSEVSEEDPEEPRWPYGWMEFAALYAKCESGSILIGEWGEYTNTALESVGIDGKDSVLAYACPGVMETGKILMEADDEGRKAAEPFLAMGLPVTQCVNLIAETENLAFLMLLTDKDIEESEFLKETDVLFNLCYEVFNNVNEQLEEEEDEAVSVVEAAAAKRSLKQLLAHVRK